ncbi:DNA internalization-related competence protein ComEC/Rec2 [Duganella ginsengisoli]|uniref:DNA internalization-related competence protein ComEC/Rec2 n=2 Tax=Pseudoduganella ginsengisoli TaxID=1462440 RepID=A0A6L6Q041_9BURK|nr:DNA internalization-related competence protein ComEC/Rec2 [Pseudoduganella ginsengisoli]
MAGIVAGALWLQTQATLPSHPAAALVCALVLSLLFLKFTAGQFWLRHCAGFACGVATGFLWSALLASHTLSDELAKADEGRDVTIIGIVSSLPSHSLQGVRFNFTVESVENPGASIPPRIALSWFAGSRAGTTSVPDVRPGQRWQLTVRLQRPHGNANPYGFDYELWLLEQGIRATGYIRQQGLNEKLAEFVPGIGNVVERGRGALRDRIMQALPDREYAGVIVALVIGDQRAISQSDWDVFNRTGISHLVSISGLHITMLAGLAAWGAAALWRRSFFTRLQLPLLMPAQKVAALAGLLTAFVYVLLAGLGVPAQRTLYMLAAVAVALWCGRIAGITHVLCFAACVTVLLDPWAVMWPGYWLSFGAVAAILYATAGRAGSGHAAVAPAKENMQLTNKCDENGKPAAKADGSANATISVDAADNSQSVFPARFGLTPQSRASMVASLKAAAHVQYAVTVGLVPLTMLLFAQFSLVSPVANAIAIPVVSLFVTPLALAGSLLPAVLGTPLLQLAHGAVWLLAQALQWLSAWPHAVWTAPVPPAWAFAWALAGTAWLLAPCGWPVRWLGLVTWLPLLLAKPDHPEPGKFRVTAFDVGQGMALLVETAGHRLLYDTGPAYSLDTNGGNRVILPYLKARGIHHVDGVIVSHSDIDHAGGALAVLQGSSVDWLASSLHGRHPLVQAARRHVPCVAGQTWRWDGVVFEILHPSADSYSVPALKPNARSCVLKISTARKSILLAGDIEAPQETQLLAGIAQRVQADVLLAPHHGSGTSSTAAFLQAVNPSVALFQVGYRNRFHHPQPQVWARYQALGIRSLRTDELGAIRLDIGDSVAVETYRSAHARYWYGR